MMVAVGYCFNKRARKWQAQIYVNRKMIYLGMYKFESEAKQAYEEAKIKYHINVLH